MASGALQITVAMLALMTGFSLGWMLAGAGGVAIPVIAHLLSRRRGPAAEFPAVRFVRASMAELARRRRLRDVLLLVCRILLVALLALAFDRPQWLGASASPAAGDAEDLIVVIDASASMLRVDSGRALFDRARDEAEAMLRALDAVHDRAGVVLAARSPITPLPALSANIPALIEEVRRARATLERADISAAIAAAAALPAIEEEGKADHARTRRIVVISDMQRSQWEDVGASSLPAGVDVAIRSVAPRAPISNFALVDGVVAPARPVVGRAVIVNAAVLNASAEPAAALVTVHAPGHEPGSYVAAPPPEARAGVAVPIVFDRPGWSFVELRLADDSFAPDNRLVMAIDVGPARRVALLTAGSATDPIHSPYYLAAALRPGDGAGDFDPVPISPASLTRDALAAFDGVVIAGAGALDAAARTALATFLEGGGGALWVVDSEGSLAALDALGAENPDLAVAIRANGAFGALPPDAPATLTGVEADSPALGALLGRAPALLGETFLTSAPVAVRPPAANLMSLADGAPLVAWSPAGAGRIVAILADIAPRASSLARSPLFPVLANELLRFALPERPGARPFLVGEPISIALAPGAAPAEPLHDSLARAVTLDQSGPSAVVAPEPAPKPGLLTITDAAGAVVALAGVTLDPRESDGQTIAEAAATGALAGRETARSDAPHEATAPQPDAAALAGRPRAIELWPALLVSALICVAIEAVLAAWRPRPASRSSEARA